MSLYKEGRSNKKNAIDRKHEQSMALECLTVQEAFTGGWALDVSGRGHVELHFERERSLKAV